MCILGAWQRWIPVCTALNQISWEGCLVEMAAIQRGEVWWADLPTPRRSDPGNRRPVLVVQADSFNRSRISTAIVAVITSTVELAEAPGNVFVLASSGGLDRDSVVHVSQLLTLDRSFLTELAGTLPLRLQREGCGWFCNSSVAFIWCFGGRRPRSCLLRLFPSRCDWRW